jgi:hypothetical protein
LAAVLWRAHILNSRRAAAGSEAGPAAAEFEPTSIGVREAR